jgi:tetratricopeptide (TPR) repeat protein
LEYLGSIEDQPKFLFAKGLALMRMGEHEKAKSFLLKAHRLLPLNDRINQGLNEVRDRINSYKSFCSSFAENLKFN